MTTDINPYRILGVHRKSTEEEIRTAFMKLAKQHHPDAVGAGATDEVEFQKAQQAYNILKTKGGSRKFLESIIYFKPTCSACKGLGVKSKSKGLTEKIYTACKVCDGAGILIEEKETENVTTKLHTTTSPSTEGSDT